MDEEVRKPRMRAKRGGKKAIARGLNLLLRKVEDLPPEIAVKVLATAIAWEKVKAKIEETDGGFDPDNL